MIKTYITTMPNHIGAFLKASECFGKLDINITRVSYNKAIDSHMLFIDAEGDEERLKMADEELAKIGYIQPSKIEKSIVLLEFMLPDIPGSVTKILNIINEYRLNISYISSQEDGTDYQFFKMGLYIENETALKEFLKQARTICQVRVLDYNRSEKVFDNSIFYQSFVSEIMNCMGLPEILRDELLKNTNLVMQILDEKGLSPYKTFESISRFAHLLASYRGEQFSPRISHHKITNSTEIILIEPPCGSNTAILKSGGQVMFIDSGYALYRTEMEDIFRSLIDDYDNIKKTICVTHADVDHCGLLSIFDQVIASEDTRECLLLEHQGALSFREQNALHAPYVSICKALTMYKPVSPQKVKVLWSAPNKIEEPFVQIGTYNFADMNFTVYQGKGGHLKGETVLIDFEHKLVFSGDIYINVHGLTKEQAEYNQYAPVLMTSVDTDPELSAIERKALCELMGAGNWQIFGAHGAKKEICLTPTPKTE